MIRGRMGWWWWLGSQVVVSAAPAPGDLRTCLLLWHCSCTDERNKNSNRSSNTTSTECSISTSTGNPGGFEDVLLEATAVTAVTVASVPVQASLVSKGKHFNKLNLGLFEGWVGCFGTNRTTVTCLDIAHGKIAHQPKVTVQGYYCPGGRCPHTFLVSTSTSKTNFTSTVPCKTFWDSTM